MQELLRIRSLSKTYNKQNNQTKAVNKLDLDIYQGEFLGLIGESGCGKSTLAGLLSGLEEADSGEILCSDNARPFVQMVFQNAQESFNPRLTLGTSVAEWLINQNLPKKIIREQTAEYLQLCGLSHEFAERYPHEVSGGECQRAAIARALIAKTQLLVCDEATSSLDVVIQAQIMQLLSRLKMERKFSCLFITHNIALAQQLCDRLAVMRAGEIVEIGATEQLINNANCEYTKKLLRVAAGLGEI